MNREIKFRAWDKKKSIIREVGEIKFDGKFYNVRIIEPTDYAPRNWSLRYFDEVILMQFTGLHDKNGKEIYEGDEIQYRKPYRTTQTHEGDNIPNGSYTEPMEPGIKTITGVVVFKDGCFSIEGEEGAHDFVTPISWIQTVFDLESIKEAISWTRQTAGWFDDPEEGDLQYLITECAKVETAEQLIEYLNGFEVIGNIYENQNLLQ